MSDWYTTLLGFAGADVGGLDVDGVDQWEAITSRGTSCPSEIAFKGKKELC